MLTHVSVVFNEFWLFGALGEGPAKESARVEYLRLTYAALKSVDGIGHASIDVHAGHGPLVECHFTADTPRADENRIVAALTDAVKAVENERKYLLPVAPYENGWYHVVLDMDTPVGVWFGYSPAAAVGACVDQTRTNHRLGKCPLSDFVAREIIDSFRPSERLEAIPVRDAIDSAIERDDIDWAECIQSDLAEAHAENDAPELVAWIDELGRFIRSQDVTIDPAVPS